MEKADNRGVAEGEDGYFNGTTGLPVGSHIAYGSVCELETQTMISGDLDYMKKEKLQKLREELGDIERMLKAMIKSLENKHLNP